MNTAGMDPQTFALTKRWVENNEGCSLRVYLDTATPPCRTIAVGLNLELQGNLDLLRSVGVADPIAVRDGRATITQAQADAAFAIKLRAVIAAARTSLAPGVFDALALARQTVVVDLEYNLGQAGWLGFGATRALINEAQAAKAAGKIDLARSLFQLVAAHLRASAWNGQVGDRAARDEAAMASSAYPLGFAA